MKMLAKLANLRDPDTGEKVIITFVDGPISRTGDEKEASQAIIKKVASVYQKEMAKALEQEMQKDIDRIFKNKR